MTDALRNAREAYKNLRADFNARMAEQWEAESARAQNAIHIAVWDMAASGASVAEIGRAYGTKDRRTITDILKQMPTNYNAAPEPTTPESTPTNVTRNEDGTVQITRGDDWCTVDPDPTLDRSKMSQRTLAASPGFLYSELNQELADPANPLWTEVAHVAGQ